MPHRRRAALAVVALVCATAASAAGGYVVTRFVESRVALAAGGVLIEDDRWVRLAPDGAVLALEGEAPDAAAHKAMLGRLAAGGLGFELIDRTTLGDGSDTLDTRPLEVAAVLDILVEGSGITLFGEVPETTLADERLKALLRQRTTSNMLMDRPGGAAEEWPALLDLAMLSTELLESGHIRVSGAVATIDGQVPEGRLQQVTDQLEAAVPDGIELALSLTAPLPVIAPYTYTAVLSDGALQVLACTLTGSAGREAVADVFPDSLEACTLGLGAPSEDWDQVVVRGLKALQRLGGGTLSLRDTDIVLTGQIGADPEVFTDILSDLDKAQPQMYSVTGSIPPDVSAAQSIEVVSPPRFTALRTDDGAVRIRGDLPGARLQDAAQSLAEAKFGFETVVNETVSRGDLPSGWSGHVIAGLEALAMLSRGQLEVTEAALTLTGTTPSLRVKDDLRAALAGELPSGMQIVLNLWEEQALEVTPLTQVPADLCAEQIALLLDGGQITFPPSESQIDEESLPIIDRIAEILSFCPGARFEIAGHTDSQGRESSNMTLSQSRADAVLGALLERGIDTVFLSARGYGETDPIAPNDTDAGRAQNRRISFEVAVEGGDVAPDEDASTPEAQLLEGEASSPAEDETQALAVSTESDAEPIEEPVDTAPEA
ncbi:MAG: OmpA family protein, partial [Pseudomonadota bacterium]